MQVNSINNVNFGIWQNKENSDKLLKKLFNQADGKYSCEDIKAMYDELEMSEKLYIYDEKENRIKKFSDKKNRFRTMHKRGFSLLDALKREYLRLIQQLPKSNSNI